MDKERFLKLALEEAKKAFNKGEVPVGAIIVKGEKIISKAHNRVEELKDPTAHAEVLAIREACKTLNTKFLEGCELYVTLEPCVMCSYALVLARVEKVIFSALDKKHGGVVSIFNILDEPTLNHRVKWEYYPFKEASGLLSEFFRKLRNNIT
ncbi:MAG: tRNA-specific adenosine deaminase [Aquifex sp.]|nr:MAG: tRNA-specific adenosine deaminase [Aquifex sp.]